MDVLAEDVVSEIYMYTNDFTCLLVEGDNDYNFFATKEFPETVVVVPACGCKNVIDAMSIIEKEGRKKALGIVDKDYRECFGKLPSSENIFITDKRDLDALFFLSDATFNKVLIGRVSRDKMTKSGATFTSIRDHVVNLAKIIGRLRVLSEGNGHNFCFKKIDYDKFIESKEVTFSTDSFVNHLKGAHRNNACIDSAFLVEAEAYVKGLGKFATEDDVCSGHDMMAILAIGLRKKWGTHSSTEMKKETVEELFRLAYSDEEYSGTALCKSILSWFRDSTLADSYREESNAVGQ